jgi:hypothetical protein
MSSRIEQRIRKLEVRFELKAALGPVFVFYQGEPPECPDDGRVYFLFPDNGRGPAPNNFMNESLRRNAHLSLAHFPLRRTDH